MYGRNIEPKLKIDFPLRIWYAGLERDSTTQSIGKSNKLNNKQDFKA